MQRNGEWDVLKPYPRQLEALRQAADGSPVREIAERMKIPTTSVSALLSGAYSRLKIKVKGERAGTSQARRWQAIRICIDHGWLEPEVAETEVRPVPKRASR